jgi:hypothetical protein
MIADNEWLQMKILELDGKYAKLKMEVEDIKRKMKESL